MWQCEDYLVFDNGSPKPTERKKKKKKCVCIHIYIYIYVYCRVPESQDYMVTEAGRDVRNSAAQPPAPSSISHETRPGYSVLYPVRSWKLPKMDTAQHLWKTCSSVWLSSMWKMCVYLLVYASKPILFFRKMYRSEAYKSFMSILQNIHTRIPELCFITVLCVCKYIYL